MAVTTSQLFRTARIFLLAVATLFASPLIGAQGEHSASKPPWLWTSEERLHARFDSRLMAARNQRAMAAMRKAPRNAYFIDGGSNPELFFHWELFDALVATFDTQPSSIHFFRESYREQVAASGWDFETFWREVEEATATYRATRTRMREHRADVARTRRKKGLPSDGGISPYLAKEACLERAMAMKSARTRLGEEQFDKFLYTAVAANTTLWLTTDRGPRELLLVEGGCQ